MKNSTFARFARAFFIFGHLADVLDLSTTWNDLFCSCPDDVSMWWQMFNFVSSPLKCWFQFNSRIVWTHFASVMTLNNSEMIAEIRSYIFIWRSCCRRRRLCLNSLIPLKARFSCFALCSPNSIRIFTETFIPPLTRYLSLASSKGCPFTKL